MRKIAVPPIKYKFDIIDLFIYLLTDLLFSFRQYNIGIVGLY